jgi:cytochrome c oxidase cbb3-type subunit III
MSDFTSGAWSIYVGAATLLSLAACLALLMIAARRRVMANDNTTGHVWDEDLRELNNPLPRWWMWLFVITVVFSVLYLALYPGLGSSPGAWGWSSVSQLEQEQAKAREAAAPLFAGLKTMPAAELARNPQAMAIGERLFANNCATCHGSDARGSKGFPNLTDSDWLWGGDAERIEETITQGRRGSMPPMATAVGTSTEVHELAHYVLSLSGAPHDEIAAARGQPKFAACAGCHGASGKGNALIGAPSLSDKVWLHGWGESAITAMVNNGKTNVMPAHGERLTPEQIHVLSAYVWGLSNSGRTTTP